MELPAGLDPKTIKALGPFGWNVIVKDGKHGAFIVNPHDQYVGRSMIFYREYSEGEIDLFRDLLSHSKNRGASSVVEAGSNIGAHTIPLARLVPEGAVFAFEPQRYAYQMLAGTASLNGIPNIKTFNAALGAEPGQIQVPLMDPNRQQNFGGLALKVDAVATQFTEAVTLMTVDQCCFSRLDLLKIDVEGMEADVLRGAQATIATARPAIYLEADRENKTADIAGLLTDMDYRAWWHFPPLYNPRNHAQREVNVFGDIVSINLLCLPAARMDEGEQLLPGHAFQRGDIASIAYKRLVKGS